MSVKRFTASSMSRALELVRQEMGPDAIILSTKRVNQKVEIVTSLDEDLPSRHAQQNRSFQKKFDQDIDLPLASDEAWKLQDGAQKAIAQYKSDNTGSAINTGMTNTNARNPVTRNIGTANVSPTTEDSAKRLAKEIEQARDRMFAAQSVSQTPDNISDMQQHNRIVPKIGDISEQYNAPSVTTEGQLAGLKERVHDRQFIPKESIDTFNDDQFDLFVDQKVPVVKSKESTDHSDQRLNELQSELAQVRALLEQQLEQSQGDKTRPSLSQGAGSYDGIEKNLRDMGLSQRDIAKLCKDLPHVSSVNRLWKEVMKRLVSQIPVDNSDQIDQGGVFAFVGATGVGKTTTIAKLAARYVMTHGINSVAIVTTDTFRIGAYDQLRSLGRILNVPVKVADSQEKLQHTLSHLCSYSLVLIDTAGFRYGDPLLKTQEDMLSSCKDVQRILVLPSNSQSQCLKASTHAYRSKHVVGCVLTKIDEASSLGEAISVISHNKLPLMYMANGQDIPKDIALSDSQNLVTEAVRCLKQQKADEKMFEQGA